MPYSAVAAKLDSSRQPHVIQPYNVPAPMNDQYARHDQAVYSMWMHFVDFCVANSESVNVNASNADQAPVFSAPDTPVNAYTSLFRLPFFRDLSNGSSIAATIKKSISSSSIAESADSSLSVGSARVKTISPVDIKLAPSPSPSTVSSLFSPVQPECVSSYSMDKVAAMPSFTMLEEDNDFDENEQRDSFEDEHEDELTTAMMNMCHPSAPQRRPSIRSKGLSFDSVDTTTCFGSTVPAPSSVPSRRSSSSLEADSASQMLADKDSWDNSFTLSKAGNRVNGAGSPDGTFSIWTNPGDKKSSSNDRDTPKLWNSIDVHSEEEEGDEDEEARDFQFDYDCAVAANLVM